MKAWDGWKTGMGGMIGRLREGGKWVFIVNILIWYFEGRVELRNYSLDIAAYRERVQRRQASDDLEHRSRRCFIYLFSQLLSALLLLQLGIKLYLHPNLPNAWC